MTGHPKEHSRRDFVHRILSAELKSMRISAGKVLSSADPEYLHDLRVAASRLSFALKSFRKFLGLDEHQVIGLRLKEARKIMGQARSFDILASRADQDIPDLDLSPAEIKSIRKMIRSRRAKCRRELVKMLRSAGYEDMSGKIRSLV